MARSNSFELTVTELSRSLKRIIEDNFGYVRLKGEVSGFKKATSGHCYFNLKDQDCFINAVCFRQEANLINFDIADGLEVIASGRITTYEGKSTYQIIIEKLEIAGIGSILAAIEERRIKLLAEGYFDEKHKKPLPFLPKKIGIITSPTGAVIEDIIHRINARFPTELLIYPALMQGKNSALEVINGIKYFNNSDVNPDLIIIARGGGSFEDLLPFSDEDLVKAVFNSTIPIISAIGHETDTSLIDYASDLRAPTPTAAAEIAVPVLLELKKLNENLGKRLAIYFTNSLNSKKNNLTLLSSNLLHPRRKFEELENKFLKLRINLESYSVNYLNHKNQYLQLIASQIQKGTNQYQNWQNKVDFLGNNLNTNFKNLFLAQQNKVGYYQKLLFSYDYKNVLARGYAVVRQNGKIISNKSQVARDQKINIELNDGSFDAITD